MDNLYSATQADLSNVPSDDETYQPQFFSVHGRLGRLRYIAYTWLSIFVLSFFSGIIAAIFLPAMAKSGANQSTLTSITLMLLIYIPIIAASLIYTKRRLNDLDQSGWFGILMLIPLLNLIGGLYLMFASGSSGSNRYGPEPAKNSVLVLIAGVIFPFLIIAIIGILAAVAIPAYKNYTERAKATASHRTP